MKKFTVAAIAAMFTFFVGGAAFAGTGTQNGNNGSSLNDTVVPKDTTVEKQVPTLNDTVVPTDTVKTDTVATPAFAIALNDTVVPQKDTVAAPGFAIACNDTVVPQDTAKKAFFMA